MNGNFNKKRKFYEVAPPEIIENDSSDISSPCDGADQNGEDESIDQGCFKKIFLEAFSRLSLSTQNNSSLEDSTEVGEDAIELIELFADKVKISVNRQKKTQIVSEESQKSPQQNQKRNSGSNNDTRKNRKKVPVIRINNGYEDLDLFKQEFLQITNVIFSYKSEQRNSSLVLYKGNPIDQLLKQFQQYLARDHFSIQFSHKQYITQQRQLQLPSNAISNSIENLLTQQNEENAKQLKKQTKEF